MCLYFEHAFCRKFYGCQKWKTIWRISMKIPTPHENIVAIKLSGFWKTTVSNPAISVLKSYVDEKLLLSYLKLFMRGINWYRNMILNVRYRVCKFAYFLYSSVKISLMKNIWKYLLINQYFWKVDICICQYAPQLNRCKFAFYRVFGIWKNTK